MSQKQEKNQYFKLHIQPSDTKKPKVQKVHHIHHKPKEKNKLKSIFKNASRQIVASLVILIIGFFLLNGSAYYKIFKSKIKHLIGADEQSPLHELVENNSFESDNTKLETSSDPEIQKKQIPELNLDIAPSDNRIIIPRIDQNIPIVRVSSEHLINRDWDALEDEMQDALKGGVVHYPGTSLPGETGNVVITGHSSYFPWDSGRFKDVFALLEDVVEGDKIVIYYEQDKYIYIIDKKEIVMPNDIEILKQTPQDKLTLITCWPVGTNLKRLIVQATPIEINGEKIDNKIVR
jgi:LPXTG-site transpeptidase (sortase) family protein